MAIQECPHCHTTVFVSGGICPACKKKVDDVKGATPGVTRRDLRHWEPLPKVCVGCGARTPRTEPMVLGKSGAAMVAGALGDALKIASGVASGKFKGGLDMMKPDEQLRFELPRCEACSAKGPVQLERYDFAQGYVTMLVHVKFGEALDELRAPPA